MDMVKAVLLCLEAGFVSGALLGRRQLRQTGQPKKRWEMQEEELARLQQTTENLRVLRHDFRHHLAMLRAYARQGDLEALEDYLAGLGGEELDTALQICANPAVNAMAQQYLGRAEAEGTVVDALLEVGTDPGIATQDLCVVFGNCMENALEAVLALPPEQREIRLRARDTPGWLSLVVENTCLPGKLEPVGEGYRSAKGADRVGMGLKSVQTAAKKYGGTAVFQLKENRFRIAVTLFKKEAGP